jgi:hypothetical protein
MIKRMMKGGDERMGEGDELDLKSCEFDEVDLVPVRRNGPETNCDRLI